MSQPEVVAPTVAIDEHATVDGGMAGSSVSVHSVMTPFCSQVGLRLSERAIQRRPRRESQGTPHCLVVCHSSSANVNYSLTRLYSSAGGLLWDLCVLSLGLQCILLRSNFETSSSQCFSSSASSTGFAQSFIVELESTWFATQQHQAMAPASDSDAMDQLCLSHLVSHEGKAAALEVILGLGGFGARIHPHLHPHSIQTSPNYRFGG